MHLKSGDVLTDTHTYAPAVCRAQDIIAFHSTLKRNGIKIVFCISETFTSVSLTVEFNLLMRAVIL